jgi:phage-related protein (TIGR01555 family)
MAKGFSGFTADSFQNVPADLGIGANNLLSASTYGFNPITRNRVKLDYMYRGSWIVRAAVDAVADDMVRAGIHIDGDVPPEDMDKLSKYIRQLQIWQKINQALKWARLYGGSVAVMMIDGQDPSTELRLDSVGPRMFKGLLVLDRWMLQPYSSEVVTELGADFGDPKYYTVVADAKAIPNMRIHHTRCLRFEGVPLPYWQKMSENGWGLSVVEPMFDRLLAFDSATTGAAQLIYKAHLRVHKIAGYRELVGAGGPLYQAFIKSMNMMRTLQTNEGYTAIDKEDEIQFSSYGFGGLSDMLIQFGQQISGALQIPLTRLFGQSPAGLNSTGESDLRNYYDYVNAEQESTLRDPVTILLHVIYRSKFGRPLPENVDFSFSPLWQISDVEKATIAQNIASAVGDALDHNIITTEIAMRELRQSSRRTGIFSNITDDDIADAKNAPPDLGELGVTPFGGAAAGESAMPHQAPGISGEQQKRFYGESEAAWSDGPALRVAK